MTKFYRFTLKRKQRKNKHKRTSTFIAFKTISKNYVSYE